MEGDIFTQLERPNCAVFIAAPLSSQHRIYFACLGVIVGQCFVNILQNQNPIGVFNTGIQGSVGDGMENVIEHIIGTGRGTAAFGVSAVRIPGIGGAAGQQTQQHCKSH